MRRLLAGAAAGLALGYAAVRAVQAVRDVAAPAAPLVRRDPLAYGATRRALMLAGIARSTAALGGAAFVLADPLERALAGVPRIARAPLFALTLLALETVRDLGVEYVEGYALERRYGMGTQTPGAWLADQGKAFAVGSVVMMVLVTGGDALVRHAPRRWPWLAIAATPPFLAFATVIAPAFVMPLFNRYEPLTGDLATRIRALATRYGVGDAAILHFDMSRRTTKANAFVTGVFGMERIAIGDTLLKDFREDETFFVVAHELGHYVRRDPWVSIAVGTGLIAATLLGADALLRRATGRGADGPAQGARFAFFATLIQLALTPAGNAFSRAIERRADRFALAATRDRDAGIRAFRRLAETNLAEMEPPWWSEVLFASHPSLSRRIKALERA